MELMRLKRVNEVESDTTQMFHFFFLFNWTGFPQLPERNPEPMIPEMQQNEEPLQMNGGTD